MKKKLILKLLALSLAFVMVCGMLPSAMAVETEPLSVAFADPYAAVGQLMHVDVTGGSGTVSYSWRVDGKVVGTGPTYIPENKDLMKWIAVTVTRGGEIAETEMFFSRLPVVYINTENNAPIVSKEDYINAQFTVQGNEIYNSVTTTLYDGLTEIRGRGNSTWGQPKKPYRLKLDKKTDLLGMGKSKHWVLLANYMDESLQRNTLAYNLSGSMGMEQMSTVYVDVILNGDFVGNYQLCENIRVDDTRVDIFDWEGFAEDSAGVIADAAGLSKDDTGDLEEYMAENMGWITSGSVKFGGVTYSIADYPDIEVPAITGGYLMELDEYYDEISKFKTASGQPIMFKNPEYVGTNKDMMNYIQTYIQAFEDAVEADSYSSEYEGETVHYTELFDFDALVDYWLINELFFNEELNKKSTYLYKDIDGLVFMGPIWDMDWSSGGEGQTYHTEQWATRYYSTNAQARNWYKYLIQDPYFFLKAQERYWEIRNDQVVTMLEELEINYELLKDSAKANGERWGYGSDFAKYTNDLRTWFNKHLTWLDAQMSTQDSLRDSLGYHPSSRLDLALTNTEGKTLPADTAKTAPADAVAQVGQALKLSVTGRNDTTGNAVLYVNSRRTSVTPFTANSTVSIDVPAEALNAPVGEKNVLEIQIEKEDGSINASRYVTVLFETGHEHSYEAVVTAPTCTEDGYTTYTCACGDSYIADETEALGHTEETIPGTPATFDNEGLTDGVKCAVCGLTLVEQETAPMLDYNDGIIPLEVLVVSCGDYERDGGSSEGPAELAVDDNLNTLWHTDWYGESRDNHWFQFEITESYNVDGLRYKPRVTGNTNGIITAYEIQVSDDGENFRTVASGKWEGNRNWKVVEFDDENVKYVRLLAVDALTDNSYVFASAAEIRLTGFKAGEAPHEHSFGEWTETKAPTCTEAGEETRSCKCGETETREIEALGHNYEAVVTEPTCTEAGFTTYTCVRCDHSYVADEVPAKGHTFGEWTETKVPTCTEAGEETRSCACGEVETREIAALGHDFVNGECSRCDAVKDATFEDVEPGDFFFDPVEWAVEEGITTGTSATTFDPKGVCQRASVVTFLWRAAGSPEPTITEENFVDVDADDFYYKAVLWAVENEITNGMDATHFGPYLECNRAQVVTFLWRAAGKPAHESNEHPFTDVKVDFYTDAMLWAVENGITTGMTATTFAPNATCNRAQVVTFLYRANNK